MPSRNTRRNTRRNRRQNGGSSSALASMVGGSASGSDPMKNSMMGGSDSGDDNMKNSMMGGSAAMKNSMMGGSASKLLSSVGGGRMVSTGSKSQVFHGTAKHTSGGLHRKDLMKTKNGRIVSRKKHAAGKKAIKNLRKLGYIAKKGSFKLFSKKSKRGGSGSSDPAAMISKLLGVAN